MCSTQIFSNKCIQKYDKVCEFVKSISTIYDNRETSFGSGALHGKMLVVKIIENKKLLLISEQIKLSKVNFARQG